MTDDAYRDDDEKEEKSEKKDDKKKSVCRQKMLNSPPRGIPRR